MYENNLIEKAKYEKEINNRWKWITEDISDKETRLNTQLVLENSYRKMVSEGVIPRNWLQDNVLTEGAEAGVINEAGGLQTSGAIGDYVIPKVMFPIIRRVMPELIANKLVSVQPLQQPTGIIYYITYKYSTDKGEVKAGDEFSGNPYQTSPAYSVYYSSEKLGPIAIGKDSEADSVEKIFKFLDSDAASADTFKRIELINKKTHRALLAKKVSVAGNGDISFYSDDGAVLMATVGKNSGTIKVSAEAREILGDKAANDDLTAFVVYNQEGTSRIPEMEFDIDHMDVTTTERKLKVRWTKEAEQDMQAYHKIDVEQELVKVAAVQTNYEIDRQIMNAINDIVITPLTGEYSWVDDEGNGTTGNYLDRHRALAQRMYQYCTKVAQYNRLAPADWAVCSPQVAAALQMLPDWKAGEIAHNKSTFYHAGALGNGTVAVYCDPNRMDNDITLGYKSKDSTYGAGIVYSPYANWMSATVVNPDNFNNIRGTFSRYGITATPRAAYNYARVTISDFAI